MNHSIHCMPSTTRAAARLLHCMSWNPKLSLKDLILKSDRSNNKKKVDDSNTLESLSESQCKAIIRLVESKYKFRIVDKSLPSLRKAAAKAFALIRERKCTPWAKSQGYHLNALSLFDIVRLETQVYDFQWAGQAVWVNVMRKHRKAIKSFLGGESLYGRFISHKAHRCPQRCDRKEHRWIVRDFAEGVSTLTKRQCRCCKTTMLESHDREFQKEWSETPEVEDKGKKKTESFKPYWNYEHFFKFQMFPVVWWLGTNARYSFDEEAENKIESRDPNANPSYYVSSEKEGVRTFEDLELAKVLRGSRKRKG